jgi:hypothetical protein
VEVVLDHHRRGQAVDFRAAGSRDATRRLAGRSRAGQDRLAPGSDPGWPGSQRDEVAAEGIAERQTDRFEAAIKDPASQREATSWKNSEAVAAGRVDDQRSSVGDPQNTAGRFPAID